MKLSRTAISSRMFAVHCARMIKKLPSWTVVCDHDKHRHTYWSMSSRTAMYFSGDLVTYRITSTCSHELQRINMVRSGSIKASHGGGRVSSRFPQSERITKLFPRPRTDQRRSVLISHGGFRSNGSTIPLLTVNLQGECMDETLALSHRTIQPFLAVLDCHNCPYK